MSNTEDHKEKGVYELGYLILPSIPEENVSEVVTRLKTIVTSAGGLEIASEDPFKMDLAYTMSKVVGARKYVVKDAYIGWMKFEVEPEAVPSMQNEVKAVDEVLRFLLIKAPRETAFTFEGARKALEEAAAPKEAQTPESGATIEPSA
ncbi:30S ribosomal protein S6 [Candidatus Parcubacteria bacterium]|nr:30S ribosomal protein S6 [Candidatus Parcubacteria bacterium]